MSDIKNAVLGIDASLTHTGVAFVSLDCGTHFLQTCIPKTRGAERLVEVEKWLDSVMHTIFTQYNCKINCVMLEGYAYSAFNQAHQMGELGGVLRRYFYLKNIPIMVVSPKTLKKWITGKGTGDKNLILLKAYRRWGIEFCNDHECDAFGLADIGKTIHKIRVGEKAEETCAQFEKEVLKVVLGSTKPKKPKKKNPKKP